jgi:single-strand selective monofunctional uracil DNA glycosylase
MNPGPWGMAQTGIPFGEVEAVVNWLGITGTVGKPETVHPRRPVDGFECRRNEVSGKRLWGWAKDRFHKPETFFRHFFVANYCPLMFFEESGKNRTPDRLRVSEKRPLLSICDRALRRTVIYLEADFVVGIGRFAAQRAAHALADIPVRVSTIMHPSPANPRANRGWAPLAEAQLREAGLGKYLE